MINKNKTPYSLGKSFVDFGSFKLRQYNDLLHRERIELFKAKKRIFSNQHLYISVAEEYAKDFNCTIQDALLVFSNINENEDNTKLLPYLNKLANAIQTTEESNFIYMKTGIKIVLMSRLNNVDFIKGFEDSLTEEEKVIINESEINERFMSEEINTIFDRIIDELPSKLFDSLADFIIKEEQSEQTVTSATKKKTKEDIQLNSTNSPK